MLFPTFLLVAFATIVAGFKPGTVLVEGELSRTLSWKLNAYMEDGQCIGVLTSEDNYGCDPNGSIGIEASPPVTLSVEVDDGNLYPEVTIHRGDDGGLDSVTIYREKNADGVCAGEASIVVHTACGPDNGSVAQRFRQRPKGFYSNRL